MDPALFEHHRQVITQEPFLRIHGVVQNQDGVIHIKAREIAPLAVPELSVPGSHDFH